MFQRAAKKTCLRVRCLVVVGMILSLLVSSFASITIASPPKGGGIGRSGGGSGAAWGALGAAIAIDAARAAQQRRNSAPPQQNYPPQQHYSPQPQYVQPQPQYVPQAQPVVVTPAPAANPLPNVAPKPNVVKIKVPTQKSWLDSRLAEVSAREARSYSDELKRQAQKMFEDMLASLRKDGVDVAKLEPVVTTLNQQLNDNESLRQIEATLKVLSLEIQNLNRAEVTALYRRIILTIYIRDGFVVVVSANPRRRDGAIPIAGIPTGIIRIVYDPAMPIGSGLLVDNTTVVAGTGGVGELRVAEASVAEALGLPVGVGDPVADLGESDVDAAATGTVIANRPDAGAEINYVLNNKYPYVIKPGTKQKLPANQNWLIEFDRGNMFGMARYTLLTGYYEFQVTANGWELVRKNFDITIDNTLGVQDFSYVQDNQVVTVKAGEVKKYEGSQPLVIKFDSGEGPEKALAKSFNKSGTYKVAVDPDTNYLDLFASVGDNGALLAKQPN